MTAKERNLLKGAIRRVFSRSELRIKVLNTANIEHFDATRPRVKNWSLCPSCDKKTPRYLMQVDHHVPIVPLTSTLEAMDWDTVVDRTWCEENNLKPICKECHNVKSTQERKERTRNKRSKKNVK